MYRARPMKPANAPAVCTNPAAFPIIDRPDKEGPKFAGRRWRSGMVRRMSYAGVREPGAPAAQATWTSNRDLSRLRMIKVWMNVSAPGCSAELMNRTPVFGSAGGAGLIPHTLRKTPAATLSPF
jgi:hypothetical protein